MLSSVDLPLPEGPSSTTNSPAKSSRSTPAQRVHLDLAHAVGLGETLGLEHNVCHGSHPPRPHPRLI